LLKRAKRWGCGELPWAASCTTRGAREGLRVALELVLGIQHALTRCRRSKEMRSGKSPALSFLLPRRPLPGHAESVLLASSYTADVLQRSHLSTFEGLLSLRFPPTRGRRGGRWKTARGRGRGGWSLSRHSVRSLDGVSALLYASCPSLLPFYPFSPLPLTFLNSNHGSTAPPSSAETSALSLHHLPLSRSS
jgi:hypothetical protein